MRLKILSHKEEEQEKREQGMMLWRHLVGLFGVTWYSVVQAGILVTSNKKRRDRAKCDNVFIKRWTNIHFENIIKSKGYKTNICVERIPFFFFLLLDRFAHTISKDNNLLGKVIEKEQNGPWPGWQERKCEGEAISQAHRAMGGWRNPQPELQGETETNGKWC